jgi:hypothetical protein
MLQNHFFVSGDTVFIIPQMIVVDGAVENGRFRSRSE